MSCMRPKCLKTFNNPQLGISLEAVADRDCDGGLCTKVVVTHPVIRKFFRENRAGGTTRMTETAYRFWLNNKGEADAADVEDLRTLTKYVADNIKAIRNQLKLRDVKVLDVSTCGDAETVETSHGSVNHKMGASGPWVKDLTWTRHGTQDEWFILRLLGLEAV